MLSFKIHQRGNPDSAGLYIKSRVVTMSETPEYNFWSVKQQTCLFCNFDKGILGYDAN